ncbi:uncharacterized protein [Cherax quadricarinatus]|uniref:uncharacterized protein n=1 Tax=Cherax quadricarinatus TaxID=27406 RepID=UPI00387E28CE
MGQMECVDSQEGTTTSNVCKTECVEHSGITGNVRKMENVELSGSNQQCVKDGSSSNQQYAQDGMCGLSGRNNNQ